MTKALTLAHMKGKAWRPEDSFGARLRLVRGELGLTVEDIALRCGVRTPTWSSWERGSLPRGMHRIVERIAEVTGVDREWLMWGGSLTRSTRWYDERVAA